MLRSTARVWAEQDRHPGDHERLFRAVSEAVEASVVLYPGSWADIAASFVWPAVTYVDTDRRATRFFADTAGTAEILLAHGVPPAERRITFVPADYRQPLPVPDGAVELLVSLHAGFVSEHCTRYLRLGGALLVHPGHGDAALAAISPHYELAAVVAAREGQYRVDTDALAQYLVPRRAGEDTRELVHRTGRGVAYTRSPFAYLFRRVR